MKILQFGAGNFMRCFLDWMLQKVADKTGREMHVTLAQLLPNEPVDEIVAAGKYGVLMRGYEGGDYKEAYDEVSVIKRAVSPFSDEAEYIRTGVSDIDLVVSNSTEAGIFHDPAATAPHNYPSHLAHLLNERAKAGCPPIMIMAMELNDRSGDLLKKTLGLYGKTLGYGDAFASYLASCTFYNTLVDRIVPGYPRDAAERIAQKTGHADKWLTSGELFHLFVIEGDKKILDYIPFTEAGLNVIVTDDKLDHYHDRKVRILNGAHTSSVPVALSAGIENVDEFASHPEWSKWLSSLMHDEIARALDDSKETHAYADEVLARFLNPTLGHKFRSIALNSVAKADARMAPTLRDYIAKFGATPPHMTQAIGKLCEMYSHGAQANFPGGPLDLADAAQIKGTSKAELVASFFPSLDDAARGAITDALR